MVPVAGKLDEVFGGRSQNDYPNGMAIRHLKKHLKIALEVSGGGVGHRKQTLGVSRSSAEGTDCTYLASWTPAAARTESSSRRLQL